MKLLLYFGLLFVCSLSHALTVDPFQGEAFDQMAEEVAEQAIEYSFTDDDLLDFQEEIAKEEKKIIEEQTEEVVNQEEDESNENAKEEKKTTAPTVSASLYKKNQKTYEYLKLSYFQEGEKPFSPSSSNYNILERETIEIGLETIFPKRVTTYLSVYEKNYILNTPLSSELQSKGYGLKGGVGYTSQPFLGEVFTVGVLGHLGFMSGKTANYSLVYEQNAVQIQGSKVSQWEVGTMANLRMNLFKAFSLGANYQLTFRDYSVLGETSNQKARWQQTGHAYSLSVFFEI